MNLDNFFRINLPYGLARNEKGEWMVFNREHMPLGFNDLSKQDLPGFAWLDLPIYTKYQNLSQEVLKSLAEKESSVKRDEDGNIVKVFIYDSSTYPASPYKNSSKLWSRYFEKLKILSGLSTQDSSKTKL